MKNWKFNFNYMFLTIKFLYRDLISDSIPCYISIFMTALRNDSLGTPVTSWDFKFMSLTVALEYPTTYNKYNIKFETFRHILGIALFFFSTRNNSSKRIKCQFTGATSSNKFRIDIYILMFAVVPVGFIEIKNKMDFSRVAQ